MAKSVPIDVLVTVEHEDRRAIYFDARQAEAITAFLVKQIANGNATIFRLMEDVFPGSLDLTAYESDGREITHIHPRPSDA